MTLKGFNKATGRINHRLTLAVDGLEKSGKSHLAMTAPGPIAAFWMDSNTKEIAEKFARDFGRDDIYVSDPYPDPEEDQKEAKKLYERFWSEYNEALKTMGTVVVDTSSTLWEIIRVMEFGRLEQVPPVKYVAANNKMRRLIREVGEESANLILLHRVKKRYAGNNWSGEYERAGFDETRHLVHLNMTTRRVERKVGGAITYEWKCQVENCTQNPDLVEMGEMDTLTFPELAMMVFPDSDSSKWGVEEDWYKGYVERYR